MSDKTISDDEISELARKLGIGPTGKYPDGKISQKDEGELGIGVVDYKGCVLLVFGKKIAWLALRPDQAQLIGKGLIDRAVRIKNS